MKKSILLLSLFTFTSLSYSQEATNMTEEIKTVVKNSRPSETTAVDAPDEILAETMLTTGISTPIVSVKISPRLRLQWTKVK